MDRLTPEPTTPPSMFPVRIIFTILGDMVELVMRENLIMIFTSLIVIVMNGVRWNPMDLLLIREEVTSVAYSPMG